MLQKVRGNVLELLCVSTLYRVRVRSIFFNERENQIIRTSIFFNERENQIIRTSTRYLVTLNCHKCMEKKRPYSTNIALLLLLLLFSH